MKLITRLNVPDCDLVIIGLVEEPERAYKLITRDIERDGRVVYNGLYKQDLVSSNKPIVRFYMADRGKVEVYGCHKEYELNVNPIIIYRITEVPVGRVVKIEEF